MADTRVKINPRYLTFNKDDVQRLLDEVNEGTVLSDYDISKANEGAEYDDLLDALGTDGANVPEKYRKPGMTVRFLNNDSRYEQWRYQLEDTSNTNLLDMENWKRDGSGGGVYDISAANNDTVYSGLADALTNGGVPSYEREGGMSVKFIVNKGTTADPVLEYQQYRLVATAFSTDTANWQGVDAEPTAGSRNLVESGGAYKTTPTIASVLSESDLDISDEYGNKLVKYNNGHIKTKNFDSTGVNEKLNTIEIGAQKNDVITSDFEASDFNVGDGLGNILIQAKGGHIKTKNFDSKDEIDRYKYRTGGGSITHTPSDSDLKIISTIEYIIERCPYADIILVSNFYAGQAVDKDAKRRIYREEIKAVADYYSLGFIDLSSLGIIRFGVDEIGYYTGDGIHAYKEAGANKIFNYIISILNLRNNNELNNKKILVLGDSSCVESPTGHGGENVSWATKLKQEFPNNATINAVSGSSWLYQSNGTISAKNVEWQFEQAIDYSEPFNLQQYDIIIITAGGNELERFNLDYSDTLKYLMNR